MITSTTTWSDVLAQIAQIATPDKVKTVVMIAVGAYAFYGLLVLLIVGFVFFKVFRRLP